MVIVETAKLILHKKDTTTIANAMIKSYIQNYKIPLLFTIACALFYFAFAYHLVRTDYTKLITLYTALFILFYKLIQVAKTNTRFLIGVAILFRLLFLVAIPNLSQDFYRFIWDGRMIIQGLNPYLYTVTSFINSGEFPVNQAQELYNGMGSLNAGHYTNYPPVNQLCFTIAALFASKSIVGSAVVMRLLIIAADLGTLYFGKKLLGKLNIPVHNIFWYILNPFIIIELTGNLHFEGVMIFFMIWGLYLLHSGKWKLAAVVLALSISVKLIPLIFLPIFFQWFVQRKNVITGETKQSVKNKDDNKQILNQIQNETTWVSRFLKLIGFYAIIFSVIILLFAPFFSLQFINNYAQTVGLWFQNFEFNASIYYIAREIGYLFRGYNEIATIGKIFPVLVFLYVLYLTFFKKNSTIVQIITTMLFALTIYFFTTTTVHPWYVATLLILSVFTNYKFPLVWSFIIIISYLAYANANNTENLWIIGLEYLVVYSVFIWEVFFKKRQLRNT